MKMAMLLLVTTLFCSAVFHSNADESFDVRQHLCTVSSYGAVKNFVVDKNGFVPSVVPDGCSPIHVNLVARHGTRSPTKKRIKELDRLSTRLETLLSDAEGKTDKGSVGLGKIPNWFKGWQSPWKGKLKGGELTVKGEDELYDLGVRIRERFRDLFEDEYHPDIFTIRATQIPRASASAVAFGMGLFNGRGSLGPGRHRAFAVTSESRASDVMLRFHDTCQNYKSYRKKQEPGVDKLKEPILDAITTALVERYQLNFTRQDVSTLWFLCKQEASLLDITDQACGLFNPSEVSLLEWTDDLEVYVLKGYGNAINYRMGVPLLQDVVRSMEQAIKAKEDHHAPGSYEKARLRFAHAETVVPFSCLLGLFREGSDYERIQREQPLELPPKPPLKRNWRGNMVAPFAGNNILALYSCPTNSISKYYVQVLHNEVPVPMSACNNTDFCPFEVFKERIVNPHLEHDYDSICTIKLEPAEATTFSGKLMKFFSSLFSRSNDATDSQKLKVEL